jgi:hypothetical protein
MHKPIPAFEGHPVDATVVKVSGTAPMDDLIDVVLGVDDVVQMITQYRCVGVAHAVDDKSGLLTRVHFIKPIEMTLAPIDPSDPSDDGIIRALPRGNS